MWRTTLKMISNLTTVLMFTLLITTLFVVITTRAAEGEPTIFGYQLKTVLSGSMEPGIQTGSIISIKPVDEETQFEKGDIITFRTADDILITHRIDQVEGDGQRFITKGDNNNAPDIEPVLAQNVVGEYTGFTIPYVGYVVHLANSKQGAVLLLILPGALLLAYSVITIWRALRHVEASNSKEASVHAESVSPPHQNS